MDMNLITLMDEYGTDEACRAFLEDLRWPDGELACPRCEGKTISRIVKRGQFDCDSCRYQFSVTAGTVFHDSHLPLRKWLLATYLMCESRKGISANQMKRTIKVSYKTAWYLCHRIRAAMAEDAPEPLSGTVEMDETFHGGKPRYVNPEKDLSGRSKRGPRADNRKVVVLGALQRGGEVRIRVAPDRTGASIRTFAEDNLSPDTDHIYSDDWRAYRQLGDENTNHDSVNHTNKEWVRGDVHTNGIESVWSLFKRSVVGSYHQLSEKHLDAYLDEFEWRFNNRENPYLFRDTLLKMVTASALPFAELVAE